MVLWALLAAFGTGGLGSFVDATIDAVSHLHEYALRRGVEVPLPPRLSVLLLGHEAWLYDRDWDEYWVRPAFEKGFFVSTDAWEGKPVGRLCLVNPFADAGDLEPLIDLVADWPS